MPDLADRALRERFASACRRAAAYGLVRCSSGNMSWRVAPGRMLIKCSRSWMADLAADDVAECRIGDRTLLNGRKPSVEVGFHAGVLGARPDIDVVLHFQTPCATALACLDPAGRDYFVLPEIPYYIGPIAEVPYLPPGSPELAAAVTEALRTRDLAMLRNHGQVTVGKDFDHAIQNAAFFELACEIILRTAGRAVPLTPDAARAVRESRRGP